MSLVKCSHCHLSFDTNVMIVENNKFFCCKGCQGVYHLLCDDGLDSFYDKLGNKQIAPPLNTNANLEKFDTEIFQDQYVKTSNGKYKEVDLIIEGIHCAACVWLNEKILYKQDGIIDANINFSNYKAKIIWDDDKLKLSQIIAQIQSIGYDAYPYDETSSDLKATKNKQSYFIKMMVAVFASMNIMMLAIAKYVGFFSGIDAEILHLVHIGELILSTPVLFYSGSIFFKGAYYGLRNYIVNMDFLVISGATLIYIYSFLVMLNIVHGDSYFDSSAMIITFVLVGKYLEVIGKKSAIDTLDKIKSKMPMQATVIRGNKSIVLTPQELTIDDIVEIKSGEKASVDGVVIEGSSYFDQSSISGESALIHKKINDKIISGTINQDGLIRYKVTATYEHSTLNNIVTIIEDALLSKSNIENRTNELSKYFSVSILSIALLSFISWYFYNGNFEYAFIISVSVITIACPCALALATPIASLIGIGLLVKKGLLFKEAKHIETMACATVLALDKTGTLTEGKMDIVQVMGDPMSNDNIDILYALVSSSNHPISLSIKKYLDKNYKHIGNIKLDEVTQIQSKGISAIYNGKNIFGGKPIDNMYDKSIFVFSIDDKKIATFLLDDKIKDGAKDLVDYAYANNIDVVMLTGDNDKVANNVASVLGIKRIYANIDPIGKENIVKRLQNNNIVVTIGDGINDAAALARSDISIAMGSGADISIAVSDIIVLNGSLKSIKDSFIISKRTYKFIKQNLFISLIYNVLTIPLAFFGYVIPLVAALSMSLSSLIVVGNSLRIKKGI